MAARNNVTRILDAHKIPYTVFELSEEKHGARETAEMLGVEPGIVFKTIVVVRSHPKAKGILAVIPGPKSVNLKRLAEFLGEKKLSIPTQAEAEKMTGLKAGGISPLALLNRGFEVVLDEEAILYEEIHISGGQLGLNIRLPVDALTSLTQAQMADISTDE